MARQRATVVRSPVPGVLSLAYFETGEYCLVDDPLCEIELMKALHRVNAPVEGVVTFAAGLGELLQEGDMICRIQPKDPDVVNMESVPRM